MRLLYLEAPRFFSPPTSHNGILWFTSEPAEDPNLGLTCLLSHLFMAFASRYGSYAPFSETASGGA